jgi:zinc protease
MTRQFEVDGVPVLLASPDGRPPSVEHTVRAGLAFRVGRADETLATAGITHVVQRLAGSAGEPGVVLTQLRAEGKPDEIVTFLANACNVLAALATTAEQAVDQLDPVLAQLLTEAPGHPVEAAADLAMFRHGARDHGLPSYPEWGLHRLTATDVAAWVREYFNRDNAVLWLAAPEPPAGLRLPLRSGQRQPVPKPSIGLPLTPAYFTGESDAVLVDAAVADGLATDVYADLLDHTLRRELLTDRGGSGAFATGVTATAVPRGDGCAVVTAGAQPLPGQAGAVLGGLLDVLTRLKVGRFESADLAAVRGRREERLYQPGFAASRLPATALRLLTGQPDRTQEQLQDDLRAIGPEEVRAVAVEAVASALLMVPAAHHAEWAGFAAAPLYSRSGVTGARFPSREIGDVTLVVGPRGVCLETPEGPITVRFEQCAIALAWRNGARHLIGTGGIAVRIEPSVYPVDPATIAAIDAGVPPEVTVWLPPPDPPEAAGPASVRS